jgi:hypothetical protein
MAIPAAISSEQSPTAVSQDGIAARLRHICIACEYTTDLLMPGPVLESNIAPSVDHDYVRYRTMNGQGHAHGRRVTTPVGVAKPSIVLIRFSSHQPYSGDQSSKRLLMPSSCAQ